MKHKIRVGGLISAQQLIVDDAGVKFSDSSTFGFKRFFFAQIDCVLMAPDNKLSFQADNLVFTIPTKLDNAKHQAAIEALVENVRQSARGLEVAP